MAVSRFDITDFGDERLDAYARLTDPQLRNRLEPEKGIFIAESFKVIDRALAAGMLPQSFLVTPRWAERTIRIAEGFDYEVPVFVGEEELLSNLTGFPLTRGALAAMHRPVLPDVHSLLESSRRIAILEGIVDATNVGAIFRSAAALGVDAVFVTPTCCDPFYRRAARVSMGTVFQVPWTRLGSEPSDWPGWGMQVLHDHGYMTAALALCDDTLSLADERLLSIPKLAMVFGTEGDGLCKSTIAACDYTVKIPMLHGVDSLNVAAASAVTFWQLCDHKE